MTIEPKNVRIKVGGEEVDAFDAAEVTIEPQATDAWAFCPHCMKRVNALREHERAEHLAMEVRRLKGELGRELVMFGPVEQLQNDIRLLAAECATVLGGSGEAFARAMLRAIDEYAEAQRGRDR